MHSPSKKVEPPQDFVQINKLAIKINATDHAVKKMKYFFLIFRQTKTIGKQPTSKRKFIKGIKKGRFTYQMKISRMENKMIQVPQSNQSSTTISLIKQKKL